MPSTEPKTRKFAFIPHPEPLDVLPTLLALVALGAILVGAKSELVTLRPTYDGAIQAVQTWATQVNHTERFLAQLAGLGIVSALASIRWRRTALVTLITGIIILAFAIRSAFYQFVAYDLYTSVPLFDGASGSVVFGPALYLIGLGGVLLVAAGVAGANLYAKF